MMTYANSQWRTLPDILLVYADIKIIRAFPVNDNQCPKCGSKEIVC